MTSAEQDAAILKAVRDGTHTLVPMPGEGRKFYVGCYGNCDISPDALVLILELKQDEFEGEEMIGHMMGDLARHDDGEWNIEDAKAGKYGTCDNRASPDDVIPF